MTDRETMIVPEYLVIRGNNACTFFGEEYAKDAKKEGAQVFRANRTTGVLNYDEY